ncbi:MAG: hypothetical protein HZY79_13190 [Rhodoblastus sp.]|nr:MAG: hypothetical protein HZY79_13190 [Rhodoblastus sp.]
MAGAADAPPAKATASSALASAAGKRANAPRGGPIPIDLSTHCGLAEASPSNCGASNLGDIPPTNLMIGRSSLPRQAPRPAARLLWPSWLTQIHLKFGLFKA